MAKNKLKLHPDNPRQITDKQMSDLKKWMKKYGDISGIVHNLTTGNAVTGNQRLKNIDIETAEITITETLPKKSKAGTTAYGYIMYEGERFAYRTVRWTKKVEREALVIANQAGGSFDFDMIEDLFYDLPLEDWGFELAGDYDGDDIDYSGRNKEIDVNDFEDKMIIVLNYTSEDYVKVRNGLNEISDTPEGAIWKLLGYE